MQHLADSMTWDLIRTAAQEEARARDLSFTVFVTRNSAFVFRLSFAMLRNVPDAEDVVQETFLRIFRHGDWEKIDDHRAYLARVAWRLSVSRPRRGETELPPQMMETAPSPEQLASDADWQLYLHQMIKSLPEDIRHPLLLSMSGELKSHQIAEILDVPEGTVRTRLLRARQLLKQKLGPALESRYGR